ncbi:hypothetical protein [Streptomyces sp. NBC_01294]|uniref:hypothetical protein n=1 Tax=Streptomyces sp. NBC_01294 TaxID=2903815 RepID=UPI002DDA22FE|nr:hypothetical protein [Streptomyces sp. NBC_01294]WRZ57632.1 hypothetical protein OG534_14685 [Streptomyces sp. NBC_01294]
MGNNSNAGGGTGPSDEEWARFQEEAAAGTAPAPREPSARARMVTERLRDTQGQEPPGWRTGPAPRERRRPGRLKAVLAVVAIAGLALIAVRPELVIDRITGKDEARQEARKAGPLPAESVRPTAPPPPVAPDQPTVQEPFRGSPALQWADGAAGIEVPEATAMGGMSKEQVADALQKAKQFLVAANLDPATLRGERPAAALALLDPRQPEIPQRVEQYLTKPTEEDTPALLFTRFDPAKVKPVGDVVKVRGSMRAEQGEPGELRVVTDYTFVHPMTKGGTSVQRTIVRRQVTLSVLDPARWQATRGRLQLHAYLSEWSNVECKAADGFLHPDFPTDAPAGPAPTGAAVDPYDRSRGIEGEGCGTVTRS